MIETVQRDVAPNYAATVQRGDTMLISHTVAIAIITIATMLIVAGGCAELAGMRHLSGMLVASGALVAGVAGMMAVTDTVKTNKRK